MNLQVFLLVNAFLFFSDVTACSTQVQCLTASVLVQLYFQEMSQLENVTESFSA